MSGLQELIGHLPANWWWLLRSTDLQEDGLAKIFHRPLAEIDALLVSSGMCKETGHGFSLQKKKWEFVSRALIAGAGAGSGAGAEAGAEAGAGVRVGAGLVSRSRSSSRIRSTGPKWVGTSGLWRDNLT